MYSDRDLTGEFLAESKEHLDKTEENLVRLEKDKTADHTERIADIFRSIHSIKGASGFMGFTGIADLSHVLETLLQMMRKGDIQPESKYIDAMLEGIDILRSMLDDIDHSDDVDISEIKSRLSLLIDNTDAKETATEMRTPVVLTDLQEGQTDFEINRFDLNNIPSEYEKLYVLEYNLHKVSGGKTPIALVRDLMASGLVVDVKVETRADNLDQDLSTVPLLCLVLYATSLKEDVIRDIAGLDDGRIIEMSEKHRPEQTGETDVPTVPKVVAACPEETGSAESSNPGESHEISESIRINVDILDRLMELAGELVLVRNQQMLSVEKSVSVSREISQRLDLVTTELQETIMRTRMQPMGNIFSKLPRLVRDLEHKLGKNIEIRISGNEVELDKTILETLTDPLVHIVRNCCDHGIGKPEARREAGKPGTGTIHVEAYHEAGQINIRVRDDGKGIDVRAVRKKALANGVVSEEALSRMREKDIYSLILLPGFSTVESVSNVSGRGVGMDVAKAAADRLGGSIEIDSTFGLGTTVHLRLPLTLAIIPCLTVKVGNHRYAIPQVNLVELVCLYDDDVYKKIESADDQEVYRLRDRLLPIVRLDKVLENPEPFTKADRGKIAETCGNLARKIGEFSENSLHFAVVKSGSLRFGLAVDEVIGTEEIVVQPMHPAVKHLGIFSGATVMGDGRVALILDVEGIARHADIQFGAFREITEDDAERRDDSQSVLLFKSGEQEQFALSLPLIRRIERIPASRIEKIGNKRFINIDNVSTLVLRLDENLDVSPQTEADEMFLLLPKHIKRPFGILMSSVVDIAETPLNLNTDSFITDGLLGTAIIRNQMTLFLDIYRLIEICDPEWFAERRKVSPPPEEKKRVLLVDDQPFFRQLVKGYLEADNYDVVTAENGKQGFERLNSERFDLIVSDLEMPVVDGWKFLKHVRAESSKPDIPAVALTALDSDEDRKSAMDAGFDAYEIKIDREQLLTSISNLLRN